MAQDNRLLGPGGAPTRATTFPEDADGRKRRPVASGVIDYFPDALVAVSEVSFAGNEQHNPGQSLRWTRGKSGDESDALMRHFLQRGTIDTDGIRHSAKVAWRALAMLQKEIEEAQTEKAIMEAEPYDSSEFDADLAARGGCGLPGCDICYGRMGLVRKTTEVTSQT